MKRKVVVEDRLLFNQIRVLIIRPYIKQTVGL